MTNRLTFALLFAAVVPGCGDLTATGGPIDPSAVPVAHSTLLREISPQVLATDSTTLASDNAAFALAAYQHLVKPGENFVFSPASISIALAMAYAGAAGTTATEMASALHFTLPPERLHPASNALDLALASRGDGKLGTDGGPMRLKIVNAAWAEKTYTFLPSYLDTLAINYGAGINLLDFVGAPDRSRLLINAWVAHKTENRIKDLLPPVSVDPSTVLVLTNVIYFNAAWKAPFDPQKTIDSRFTLLDGSTVPTKLMKTTLRSALGVQGTGFVAAAVPYQDERLSLLVVVPDGGTFETFESSLDEAKLDGIVAGLTSQQIQLILPRFRVETGASVKSALKTLGMASAFLPGAADLSGMDGTRNLYIDDVIQKAFIAVGEKGTEAAAATAVSAKAVALPMGLNVFANRPFLYFLRDEPTGAILFMGRVLDPTKT